MSKTLVQKNTLYLLVWLPVVLLLGSLLFFVIIIMHSHHMQEKQLGLKQQNVWKAFVSQPASITWHISGEYTIEEGKTLTRPEISLHFFVIILL